MPTIASTNGDRALSISRVLSRTFEAIGAHPTVILGTIFLVGVLPGLILNLVVFPALPTLRPQFGAGFPFTPAFGLVGLITFVLTLASQTAAIHLAATFYRGGAVNFGDGLTAAVRSTLPLLLLSIIAWVLLAIGFVLLLVPGFIFAAMWAVAPVALIEERRGVIGSFGRSRYLTKGARWKVFGFELILIIVFWFVSAILGLLMIGISGGPQAMLMQGGLGPARIIMTLLNGVISTLLQAWWAAGQAALFLDLVEWKDGPDTDHLAEIFS